MAGDGEVTIREERDLERVWPELVGLFAGLHEYHRPLTAQELLPDWQHRLRTMLESALRSGNSLLLVARRSGEAVGFLNAHFYQDAGIFQGRTGFIDNAYVKPELRGRRVASRLVATAEAWFRAKGAKEAELNVVAANELGRRVWQALGYGPFSERRRKRLA